MEQGHGRYEAFAYLVSTEALPVAVLAGRELRARAPATHELSGYGSSEQLTQLEELLSHDEWEPVSGRVELWRELRLLLEADLLLRSHLSAPAAVEE